MSRNDCNLWREPLETDAADGVANVSDLALAAHLETCADCVALHRRRAALARLMRTLPRRGVPSDLEGRVVAAFHAGQRESRVVREFESLGRHNAPADLEQLVASDLTAPPVLDRLVAESLADLPRTISRGMTDKLERLEAPASLATRVDQRLLLLPRRERGMRLPVSLTAVAALALFSALWVARPWSAGSGAVRADSVARWSFEVERAGALDPDSMDPENRKIIQALVPEFVSVH